MEVKHNRLFIATKLYLLIPIMFLLFSFPAFIFMYTDFHLSKNSQIDTSINVTSSDEFFAKGMATSKSGNEAEACMWYSKAMEHGHPIAKKYILDAVAQGDQNAIDALEKPK